MSPRRGIAAIVGLAVAALVVTLIVVVAGADSPPSAGEALASAKRFVDRADSVEYRGESRSEYSDPEFPEDDFSEKSTFEDAAIFPDRSRTISEYEDFVSETIVIDEVSYTRGSEGRDSLEGEQWIRFDPREEGLDEEEFFTPGLGGLAINPSNLPRLFAAATHPRLLQQDDESSILRTRIDTESLDEIYYTRVRADIVVEHGGRIREVRLRAGDEYETVLVRAVFERWNRDVSIDEPDDADIDPTPEIQEDDIAAYDDAALFQPRAIPVDWELTYASVVPEEEDFTACDQVNLSYYPAGEDLGYLDLYLYPTSCAEDRPRGADDFTAGPYAGWVEAEEGYLYGEIAVGDTIIEFDTDLSVDELGLILGDLVPLDFANPPTATIPLS